MSATGCDKLTRARARRGQLMGCVSGLGPILGLGLVQPAGEGGSETGANWPATASGDDGLACAMRGGQLVMEEMRSQAELGCPAAVGNCHDQISRKRVARRSFWGGGRKHWQWLAKKWHRADADDLGNFATIKSPVRLNARGGQRVNTACPTGLARLLLRGKLLSRCCCPVRVGGSGSPSSPSAAVASWCVSWGESRHDTHVWTALSLRSQTGDCLQSLHAHRTICHHHTLCPCVLVFCHPKDIAMRN